ncbi:hypothetical protein ACRYI5_01235 [Furfurilactobacillus sp. WILCCON 0119]
MTTVLTSIEQVKLLVGDATELSADLLTQLIMDASQRVIIDRVPGPMQASLARLYAAHLVMVCKQATSGAMAGVTTEKVGPIERDYGLYDRTAATYDDPFIKEYQSVLNELTTGRGDNSGQFI